MFIWLQICGPALSQRFKYVSQNTVKIGKSNKLILNCYIRFRIHHDINTDESIPNQFRPTENVRFDYKHMREYKEISRYYLIHGKSNGMREIVEKRIKFSVIANRKFPFAQNQKQRVKMLKFVWIHHSSDTVCASL